MDCRAAKCAYCNRVSDNNCDTYKYQFGNEFELVGHQSVKNSTLNDIYLHKNCSVNYIDWFNNKRDTQLYNWIAPERNTHTTPDNIARIVKYLIACKYDKYRREVERLCYCGTNTNAQCVYHAVDALRNAK